MGDPRLETQSSIMKITILAAILAAGIAAPVSEDAIVPESAEVASVPPPEIFAQESSATTDEKAKIAPCTAGLLQSARAAGSTFRCSGPGPRAGHPIVYAITVPSHCTSSSKCGVIIDIHGQTMNTDTMEAESGLKKAALAGKKYMVISPEDYDNTWEFASFGQHDDASLISKFLVTKALVVYKDIVDTNRIHSTGFSAGSINSFHMLCTMSAQICSIAGIGFNPIGEFVDAKPPHKYYAGVPTCFNKKMGGTGPAHKRSILFHQGKVDPYFTGKAKNAFVNSVTAMNSVYGITGDGEKLNKGAGVDWTRYKGDGITVEAAEYKFANPFPPLKGHCIPKKGTPTSPSVAYPHAVTCGADAAGHVAGYTWGDEVIEFFEANPCKGSA